MRHLLPAAIVRRLPKPAARRVIRSRIAHGRLKGLSAYFPPQGDPLHNGALWECLDYLAECGAFHRIGELQDQAGGLDAFERFLLDSLAQSGPDTAEWLEAEATTGRFGPFERMCLRSWALFLKMRQRRCVDPPAAGSNPVTVMQFWAQPTVPDGVQANLDAWARLFPDRWRRFDDDSAYAFLADQWGGAEAETFRAASHPAIRSDYFRLGYLARAGGVYVDADAAPRRHTRALLEALPLGGALCFETSRARAHVQNAFIAAPAGSPFLIAAFEEAGRRLRANEHPVQALAGGYMLSDVATMDGPCPMDEGYAALSSWVLRHEILRPHGGAYKKSGLDWRGWEGRGRR